MLGGKVLRMVVPKELGELAGDVKREAWEGAEGSCG
jgi:hypothetical protein